jgi:peptidyl-prolyl cis-trans isomerase A (cyclophilin A)
MVPTVPAKFPPGNLSLEFDVASSYRDSGKKCCRHLAAFVLAWLAINTVSAEAVTPTNKVRFYMNMGTVEIELYGGAGYSPLNVTNFLKYVDDGSYNNSIIHRTRSPDGSQPLGYDLFAQGGSFKYPTTSYLGSNPINPTYGTVVNEFHAANGLSNVAYTLAAARGNDVNSASSGWFINQTNNANAFDSGPYTVLGKVTLGSNIIDQIPFLPNLPGADGTPFESTPFYNNDLVVIQKAVRIPILRGDYNSSGSVTMADYTYWRQNFGSTTNAAADGNGDGVVNGADYVVWRRALAGLASGTGDGDLSAIETPEPAGAILVLLGLLIAAFTRGRVARTQNTCG